MQTDAGAAPPPATNTSSSSTAPAGGSSRQQLQAPGYAPAAAPPLPAAPAPASALPSAALSARVRHRQTEVHTRRRLRRGGATCRRRRQGPWQGHDTVGTRRAASAAGLGECGVFRGVQGWSGRVREGQGEQVLSAAVGGAGAAGGGRVPAPQARNDTGAPHRQGKRLMTTRHSQEAGTGGVPRRRVGSTRYCLGRRAAVDSCPRVPAASWAHHNCTPAPPNPSCPPLQPTHPRAPDPHSTCRAPGGRG